MSNKTIRNRVSKSNVTEIIALLYLIAATQTTGVLQTALYWFAIWNVLESIFWSFYFAERLGK